MSPPYWFKIQQPNHIPGLIVVLITHAPHQPCVGSGTKTLSTAKHTTSNLLKHLLQKHNNMKFVQIHPTKDKPSEAMEEGCSSTFFLRRPLFIEWTHALWLNDIFYGYFRFYVMHDSNSTEKQINCTIRQNSEGEAAGCSCKTSNLDEFWANFSLWMLHQK